MKVLLLGVAMVMMAGPPALAGTIVIDWISGYHSSTGGEFNIAVTNSTGLAGIRWAAYVDGLTKNLITSSPIDYKDFESFCLEKNEYVSIPGTYTANINYVGAVAGGVGGTKVNIGGVSTDPISIGTAYLYSHFADGTLASVGYDYTPGSNRVTSATRLQEAIWYLEGEITSYSGTNVFVNKVISEYGSLAAAQANANGAFHVAALNLSNPSGGRAQDQLVIAPEPASLLLLGIGLLGAASLRRKFRKS